jgi:hypothetical protein
MLITHANFVNEENSFLFLLVNFGFTLQGRDTVAVVVADNIHGLPHKLISCLY